MTAPSAPSVPADPPTSHQINDVSVPAEIWAEAVRMFGTEEAADHWLRGEHRLFEGRPPVALIAGGDAQEVRNLLGQLSWGIAP